VSRRFRYRYLPTKILLKNEGKRLEMEKITRVMKL